MKKIALLFLFLFAGVSSLFAGEAAVKQAIINDVKLCAEGKLMESVKYHTKDYVNTDLDKGEKLYYNDILLMATALDGKHPEEFMLMLFRVQSGKAPTPEQDKELRKAAQSEQFKTAYPRLCDMINSVAEQACKHQLKTLKFIKVDVKGNLATAVTEYETLDIADKTLSKKIRKTTTHKLRKVNGIWMFYEQTVKKDKIIFRLK